MKKKLLKKADWNGFHDESCTKWVNDEGCECWNPNRKSKEKIEYSGISGTEEIKIDEYTLDYVKGALAGTRLFLVDSPKAIEHIQHIEDIIRRFQDKYTFVLKSKKG